MRDDATKDEEFKSDDAWRKQKYQNDVLVKSPKDAAGNFLAGRAFSTNSLSGNERNRLFMRAGDDFADVSTVSGADDLSDGRSFALLDFDGDGWQDLALMSLNVPRFKLFRNRFGEIYPERQSIKILLTGGQQAGEASSEFSNRDAIGSKVLVTYSDGSRVMLHRQSGEGFAGQNSRHLQVGVPEGKTVDSIEVQWPSGKTSQLKQPSIDKVVRINERD